MKDEYGTYDICSGKLTLGDVVTVHNCHLTSFRNQRCLGRQLVVPVSMFDFLVSYVKKNQYPDIQWAA